MTSEPEPLPKLILIASDDERTSESIELMLRAWDYPALRLICPWWYDEILSAAKLVGPALVICYGSLRDQPAVKYLRDLAMPLIAISAYPPGLEGATASMLTLTSPFHSDELRVLVERALKITPPGASLDQQ